MGKTTILAVVIVAIFLIIVWMSYNKPEYEYQSSTLNGIVYFSDGNCDGCNKMENQVRQRLKEATIVLPGNPLYSQHISPGVELPQLFVNGSWYKGLREVQQQVLDYL